MQPARKHNEVRSKSLFYRLLLSYIVFLMLPVALFFIFINSGLLQYAEETVHKANVSKLELVETNIDSLFADMRSTAFRITGETRIMALFSLAYDQHENRFQDMEALYDAYQLASDIKKNYRDAVSIYLYDQSKDIVFSLLESVYTRERFYDTQWIGSAEGTQGETLLGIRDITDIRYYRNPYRQVITYILPLKYLNVNGSVVINVSLEAFNRNFVSASGGAEEGYIVVDDSGVVIYDVNDRLNNADIRTPDIVRSVLGRDDRDAESFLTHAGGKSYLIMYRKAPVSGLTIINTIPLDAQYDKLLYYRMLLYVIAGLTILLGVAVSFVTASRLYNPVKKVLEKLKNQVEIDPRRRNNELNIISDAIGELVSKSQKDSQIIEHGRRHLRESYVMSLVMGQMPDDAQAYDFLEGSACCVLASIDRYEAFSAAYSYREQYYYKSLILNVCEKVIALKACGAGAALEKEKIAFIVSSRAPAQEFELALRDICEAIAAEMSAVRDFTISLGVGSIYENPEDMRRSFTEASAALKYRLSAGHGSVLYASETGNRHAAYAFPVEKQNRLLNHLKLNAMHEICPLLEETVADMKSALNRNASADSVMQVFAQLAARTLEYADAEGIDRKLLFDGRDLAYELTGKETLDDILNWLTGIFGSIVDYQQAHRQRPYENDHVNRIVDMIRCSYTDSNLSIEYVADKLDLSYSHVRKIFKECIGMNFVDYLNRMRIACAKQLLLKTDLTIREVAEQSGYNNDQCLTRFFKRYEGITPGRYRLNWSHPSGAAFRDESE